MITIGPTAYRPEHECGLVLPFFFFLTSYNGLAPRSETEVVKSTGVQEHSDFSLVFPSERRLMNWIQGSK